MGIKHSLTLGRIFLITLISCILAFGIVDLMLYLVLFTSYPGDAPYMVCSLVFLFKNWELVGNDVSAPLLYQAQKWLREAKGIDVLVWNCSCGYGWEISKADPHSRGTTLRLCDDNGEDRDSGMWLTYENALAAGIAAAMKLLDN